MSLTTNGLNSSSTKEHLPWFPACLWVIQLRLTESERPNLISINPRLPSTPTELPIHPAAGLQTNQVSETNLSFGGTRGRTQDHRQPSLPLNQLNHSYESSVGYLFHNSPHLAGMGTRPSPKAGHEDQLAFHKPNQYPILPRPKFWPSPWAFW